MKFILKILLFLLFLFVLVYGWILLKPYNLDNLKGYKTEHFVTYKELNPLLVQAFISTEDNRFFSHHGFDSVGIIRAVFNGFKKGKPVEGGSTITQQLVKNAYLSQEKTVKRKLYELAISINVESHNSKEKIFETYLNYIYFGDASYGIKDASENYFGKDVNSLSLEEIALLAGLPQAPSLYDPRVNPDLAKKRRNTVLHNLYKNHYIDEQSYQKALKSSIDLISK